MEKSTADQRVEARPAKMRKLRVHAITPLAHAPFEHLQLVAPACRASNAGRREALNAEPFDNSAVQEF
jgi:hypothetical protein